MARTKKVHAAGTFGSRYGKKLRDRYNDVMKVQKAKHTCTKCYTKKIKRLSPGIWECQKCGYKFAGKAYSPA